MKVVHLSFWENQGGAAIAANRLHKAMIASGIDSKMLVFNRSSNDETIFTIDTIANKIRLYAFNLISSRLLAKFRPYVGNFSISIWGLDFSSHFLLKEADVIYIHWINNSYISIKSIQKILKSNKCVIWFLHDMWPLTGGCHHSFDCIKYQSLCQMCDLLKSRNTNDISLRQLIYKKNKLMGFNNLLIVTPSIWLSNVAKKSMLFSKKAVFTIPNLINIEIFKSAGKEYSRKILNLPLGKRLILFGADMGPKNPYKGWTYLKSAINQLDKEYEVVTFGSFCNLKRDIPLNIHEFGKFSDAYALVLLYSACDVFVIPSLAESFGQTALESMACGTPVVGFDIGGIPDIVLHKRTGYLVKYKNAKDLADGISWILEEADSSELSLNCIKYVTDKFDSKLVTLMHLNLIKYSNDRL